MFAPLFFRKRVLRKLLAIALVCNLGFFVNAHGASPVAMPTPDALAPPAHGPRYVARADTGLGALAPALPMPIQVGSSVMVTAELPACGIPPADAQGDGASDSGGPAIQTHEIPADGPADPGEAQVRCEAIALTPPGDADEGPDYALGYVPPPPGSPGAVKWVRPLGAPKPWFSGVSPQDGVVLGDRNVTYRSVEGPSLAVGNLTPFTPAWGGAAPVGGVQVSNLTAASDTTVPEGKLGYSSVWGRINNTDASALQGGAEYGATVGTSSLRYGLTRDLTLESQMQNARSLNAAGLGTTYSVGEWGTLQAGATQSRFDTSEGWRYRLGYNVDVLDSVTVGYANEQTQAGYGDLSTYETGVVANRQTRNTFSAGLPMGSWGTLSGTYSGLRDADGVLAERRYGLSQSIMLAPGVRFAVGADRDTVTGDYAVNMQLSVPMGH